MLRKTVIIIVLYLIPVFYLAAQDIETEKESVKKVIQSAYIDGLHNKGELIDVEKGFHPGFVLLGVKDNSLTQYPIYTWIESFNKRKKDDPTPIKPENKIVCEYLQIDITGNAAMAKIQLKRNNELIFTDYLLLYKFDDGWKIVSKTYFRH